MQRAIQLLSGTGDIVSGLLCSMSERHLEDFETIWKGVLRATAQSDSYWSWDYKLRQGNQDARYEAYPSSVTFRVF